MAEDWTPKKLEVEVPLPDTLDLEHLRSSGPAAGEVLQPEEERPAGSSSRQQDGGGGSGVGAGSGGPAASAAAPEPDAGIVAALVSMGFSENGSKRAGEWACLSRWRSAAVLECAWVQILDTYVSCLLTKRNLHAICSAPALATKNAGAEAATEWVFAHMEDADFNDPLPAPGAAAASGGGNGGGVAAAGTTRRPAKLPVAFFCPQGSIACIRVAGSPWLRPTQPFLLMILSQHRSGGCQ